jgi:hypothetical protein
VTKTTFRFTSNSVNGVQLAIAEDAEAVDHLVKPEDAIRIVMARQ